jgi:hypothetical protein
MAKPNTPKVAPTYAPGARVQVRGEEWIVRDVSPARFGYSDEVAVRVVGVSELVRDKECVFLTELDEVIELKPEATKLVLDPSPRFRRSKLYISSLLRQSPPSDAELHIGHKGAMRPADYQLVPAAKALSQPRPRILIADGVGLGKTIEAGILLAELIRRGRGRRILVVALKSILGQFQQELWARFTIPLTRLDSKGVERMQARIPVGMNPFNVYDRVIVSIDTLKKEARYRRYLEQTRWDIVVIDECQNVAFRGGRGSQRNRLANLLGRTTDALVLTSATPHDGRPQSFASLMNMLEPTAVANEDDYKHDEIKGLYVRRFKKDIGGSAGENFTERALTLEHAATSPEEEAVLLHINDLGFRTMAAKKGGGHMLFKTTLRKAALSSPAACAATAAERIRRAELTEGAEAGDEDAAHDLDELEQLIALCEATTPAKQAKLQRLFALLDGLGYTKRKRGPRVVIFSERRATLDLLQGALDARYSLKNPLTEGPQTDKEAKKRLAKAEIAQFHGSLTDIEQQQLVKRFGAETSPLSILLASDAAAEGINLHYSCHRLVHYDIPWSLITLEQRNGRIDRFGQTHTPDLRYLLSVPEHEALKGDQRVLERLIEKENAAHHNLGDAARLLNLFDPIAEEARIALGIERHEAPEVIVPDAPPEADAFFDFFDEALEAEEHVPPPRTAEPLSLYSDDLAYTRDALAEIADSTPSFIEPEYGVEHPTITFTAPPDLQRRYDLLPRALQKGVDGHWTFQLTTDRARVESALAESRKDANTWPEWELLWPLHPIAQWLDDRVLGRLERHEAPVLTVHQGLAPGERVILLQAVLSNKRSQPVLARFFAARFPASGPPVLQDFEALVADTQLDQPLVNAQGAIDAEALEALLPEAVSLVTQRMATLRVEAEQAVAALLKPEQKRVKKWRDAILDRLDAQQAALTAKRRLRADEKKRFEQQTTDVEQRVEARQRWIDEGLRAVERPYVRVVAAMINGGA